MIYDQVSIKFVFRYFSPILTLRLLCIAFMQTPAKTFGKNFSEEEL